MDWVTDLPTGGDRIYNACLVLVDRYSKAPTFLPCHKYETAMETAIMISLQTNLNKVFGKNLSFSTAYHPQADGIARTIIQTLKDSIRRFCAYRLEFKDFDDLTHDCCTLIPALDLAYRTSIHSSNGKTPAILEKGWNPRLPYRTLKKDLVDIYPTASSCKIILEKARHHANGCPKKLKNSFAGLFMIKALHGPNSVQLKLTGELMNKHPTFILSLIKPYSSSDKELFTLRNKPPIKLPPLEEREEKKIVKVLKERRTRNKKERKYLIGYTNPTQEDEWILEKDITNTYKLPRRLRHERRPKE
ncbi:hypothetical protein O181_041426 [Austropuccinia psidii MF-1]|uniref:Integrase catalytic domain-containing protein n=1 Tax=Austropuccinia psidii MF-1 TaxID=1389203 RepID=A0A9Q3DJP0_9BASI|nr:hypothetical protein [Austropuccinia psidii MF-1]